MTALRLVSRMKKVLSTSLKTMETVFDLGFAGLDSFWSATVWLMRSSASYCKQTPRLLQDSQRCDQGGEGARVNSEEEA